MVSPVQTLGYLLLLNTFVIDASEFNSFSLDLHHDKGYDCRAS